MRRIGVEGAGRAIRLGTAMVLSRLLSTSDYGLFNGGYAWAVSLSEATDSGLHLRMGREAAQPNPDRDFLSRLVAFKLLLLAGMVVVAGVLGWIQGSTQGQVTWLWAGAMAATSAVDALGQLLRARGRIGADNAVQLLLAIGGTTAAIGAVALGAGVVGGAAGQAVGALLALVLAVWFARQLRDLGLVPWWRLGGQGPRTRIGAAVPWALGVWASRLYATVDLMVLGHLRGPEEVAMMAVALKPVFGAMVIPNAVSNVVYPALARARGAARGRLAWRAVVWLAAAGLVAGTAMAWMGRPLVTLLFGGAYASAAEPLVPLAIGLTWMFPEWLLGQTLLTYGQARAYAIGWVATLVLTIAGEFLVVPGFGAVGAAWVKTAATAVLLAWQIGVLAHTLRRDSREGVAQPMQ